MVLLDVVEIIQVVDHDPERLAHAIFRAIGQKMDLLESRTISQMEPRHRVDRQTAPVARMQQVPGGGAQQRLLHAFARVRTLPPAFDIEFGQRFEVLLRQGEGLVGLPFAASLFGRKEVELSRIGSLSGSEGIISVLNREMERRGKEPKFGATSRVVKQIYDRIQDEYDGQFDAQHDHWVNARRAFFTSEDILALAREFGALEG